MISVLIATKDRPRELRQCLRSLLASTYRDFEALILDQSGGDETEYCVRSFHSRKFRYIRVPAANKSKALNAGLAAARGTILSFTDDDCVSDRDWLRSIHAYFTVHPEVVGVFGRTLPYRQDKHNGSVCPAIFYKPTETVTSSPKNIFCITLGQGNNMSFRKCLFKNVGGFNEAFGPGALVPTAEDCEFIYRALSDNYTLAYTPSVLVYHNKWLSHEEERDLQVRYTLGICACSVYSFRRNRDPRVLSLLMYKIDEHVIHNFSRLFHPPELRYIMCQIRALIQGIYAGLTLP